MTITVADVVRLSAEAKTAMKEWREKSEDYNRKKAAYEGVLLKVSEGKASQDDLQQALRARDEAARGFNAARDRVLETDKREREARESLEASLRQ